MNKILLIFLFLFLLASCVQEIPVEELENEEFVDTPVENTPIPVVDTTAPVLSGLLPMGTLPESTTMVSLSVTTNEDASCRYDLTNKNFDQMVSSLSSSNNKTHTAALSVTNDTSYSFFVRCQDLKQNESTAGVISFKVDKKGAVDTVAPLLSNLLPTGDLASGTTQASLQVSTNEGSVCKYSSNQNANYDQMLSLNTTNGTSHSVMVNSLMDGGSYTYYVLCKDLVGNQSSKGQISFGVKNLELDGAKLYADNCMSCHGSLQNSTKKESSSNEIQLAIATISQMQSLNFLTEAQLKEIAKVLSNNPPNILSASPSGALPSTTTKIELQVSTNEAAECKYSAQNTSFQSMTSTLAAFDGQKTHKSEIAVSDGTSYSYFVLCQDTYGNLMTAAREVKFSVIDKSAPDTQAPVITAFSPNLGTTYAAGTKQVKVTLTTNEVANCRYASTNGAVFANMSAMEVTGATSHEHSIANLEDGKSYVYYLKCRDQANNESEQSALSFSINAFSLDGAELYAQNCMTCHGNLQNSAKKNRSSVLISNAIQTISVMQTPNLQGLSSAQVNAIAAALKVESNPGGENIPADRLTTFLLLGDRRYLDNVILTKVFGIPDIESPERPKLRDDYFIFTNYEHGGPCDPYAGARFREYGDYEFYYERCPGLPQPSNYADKGTTYSTSRASFIVRSCETNAADREKLSFALSSIGGSGAAWSSARFTQLYQKFYAYEEPASEVVQKFQAVFQAAGGGEKGWRSVLVAICISPGWQVL